MKSNPNRLSGVKPQRLAEMPRNRLSLPVLVRSQPDRLRLRNSRFEVVYDGFFLRQKGIYGYELLVRRDFYGQAFFR